ncbi:hypothetical protein D3C75_848330 [compost metagenome]
MARRYPACAVVRSDPGNHGGGAHFRRSKGAHGYLWRARIPISNQLARPSRLLHWLLVGRHYRRGLHTCPFQRGVPGFTGAAGRFVGHLGPAGDGGNGSFLYAVRLPRRLAVRSHQSHEAAVHGGGITHPGGSATRRIQLGHHDDAGCWVVGASYGF